MSRTTERSRSTSVRPSRRDEDAAVGHGPQPLRRSLTRIAVPTALAALGAGTYVTAVTPRYTGQATIIVEGREGGLSRPATNRVQAALSHDLAREAALRLKLVGNPEFDPAAAGIGPFQQAMILLGIGQNPLDQPAEDRVVESYLDHLLVSPAGNTRVATLEFSAEDAQLAADGANLAAQLTVSAIVASEGQAAPGGASAQDIASLRRQVAEAQAKVEAYRARNGLAASAGAAGQALSTPQLADLSNQLSMARLQRADLAGRITAIKDLLKDGRAFETADIANTDSLRRMIDNRIAVKAQLAFESRTLLPAHPRIKGLKAQLEDLDGQIKTSAERALRTMENDVMGADARIASLQAAVDGQRRMGNKDALVGGELAGLEREAAIQRDL
ncbi:MAG: lipopolysaccharide biosynthesis protein, partial [Parafilimonas terrae]|nr:lipopolysaccharide biosynthesis protein [Parafilimonas terrae]